MYRVFLLIGGNIGDRESYLARTISQVESKIGSIVSISGVYESEPWGFEHETPFLNQVLEVITPLTPLCLLDACQQIEQNLGRPKFSEGYSARTADIDILFINDYIFTLPPLVLPHKLLHERMFVLEPLSEIAPDFVHPLLGKKINDIRGECQDQHKVWEYNPVHQDTSH